MYHRYIVSVWIQLIVASMFMFLSCGFLFLFFIFYLVQPALVDFFTLNSVFVHCLRTHKFHFSVIFLLKMGHTTLFTHLKIILLQYFQFQFSVSAKINSIQTDSLNYYNGPERVFLKYLLIKKFWYYFHRKLKKL